MSKLEEEKLKLKIALEAVHEWGVIAATEGPDVAAFSGTIAKGPDEEEKRSRTSKRRFPPPDGSAKAGESPTRPKDIPSTREMIISVVRDANINGKGITQLEVISGIRRKWWPDAPDNRIRPMFWSLWKEKGVLVRKRDKC